MMYAGVAQSGPLVTMLAICYNHSRFVINCLESIRHQTYSNVELIVLDDCSTDNSVALINEWIARHAVDCRFVQHRVNAGVCRTLNEGITLARGKYISMIATDESERMFTVITTSRYFMSTYFAPNVVDPNNAQMEINRPEFERVGTNQYPHIEHPSFNVDGNASSTRSM